jgi:hypothetical protein
MGLPYIRAYMVFIPLCRSLSGLNNNTTRKRLRQNPLPHIVPRVQLIIISTQRVNDFSGDSENDT